MRSPLPGEFGERGVVVGAVHPGIEAGDPDIRVPPALLARKGRGSITDVAGRTPDPAADPYTALNVEMAAERTWLAW